MNPTNGDTSGGSAGSAGSARIEDVEWAAAVVHEEAHVSRDAVVGAAAEWRDRATQHPAILAAGVIVREFATVHAGCERPTVVGAGTLLMTKAHVGHDTWMGEGCEVAPNASIGGCCTLGDRVRIGMNACIRPHVHIADDVRIGMGAVVLRDIDQPGTTWAGVPARRVQ